MKTLFTLMILMITVSCYAQRISYAAPAPVALQTPGTTDTITRFPYICLDSTVVSFTVSVFTNGRGYESRVNGRCFTNTFPVASGTRIYITQIVASPKPGVTTRLPEMSYYVR